MSSFHIDCSSDVNCFFFFKQKTAYEMRISDWSSDVCSSDLSPATAGFICRANGRVSTRTRSPPWRACPILNSPHGSWRRSWRAASDPKSVVEGKSVSVRVALGGRRNIKKTNKNMKRVVLVTSINLGRCYIFAQKKYIL